MTQESSPAENVRPFHDIPEVGYSLRHPSWLMLLAEEEDGMAPFLAEVEAFTVSRHGTEDATRGGLSEHTVYDLIAAGIRIGERRRLLAEGVLRAEVGDQATTTDDTFEQRLASYPHKIPWSEVGAAALLVLFYAWAKDRGFTTHEDGHPFDPHSPHEQRLASATDESGQVIDLYVSAQRAAYVRIGTDHASGNT